MDKVIITKPIVGICHMQVCTEEDITDQEILDVCNSQNPSGTTSGWQSVIRHGEGELIDCDKFLGRKHFLVGC